MSTAPTSARAARASGRTPSTDVCAWTACASATTRRRPPHGNASPTRRIAAVAPAVKTSSYSHAASPHSHRSVSRARARALEQLARARGRGPVRARVRVAERRAEHEVAHRGLELRAARERRARVVGVHERRRRAGGPRARRAPRSRASAGTRGRATRRSLPAPRARRGSRTRATPRGSRPSQT